jgi:hypothetical protein
MAGRTVREPDTALAGRWEVAGGYGRPSALAATSGLEDNRGAGIKNDATVHCATGENHHHQAGPPPASERFDQLHSSTILLSFVQADNESCSQRGCNCDAPVHLRSAFVPRQFRSDLAVVRLAMVR